MSQVVSIVTIGYNEYDKIEQTLSSVRHQTYDQIEHIVIDGGSIDGTLDIIHDYADSLAYVESGQDSGISNAFNRGIQQATGELVALLNAGDWYHRNTVETVVEYAAKHSECDVIYGDLMLVNEDGAPIHRRAAARCLTPNDFAYRMPAVPHPTVFARRACYIEECFDEGLEYAMDYDWLRRLIQKGRKFSCVETFFPLAYMPIAGKSNNQYDRTITEVYNITRRYGDNHAISYLYNKLYRIPKYHIRRLIEDTPLGDEIIRRFRSVLVRLGIRDWKTESYE